MVGVLAMQRELTEAAAGFLFGQAAELRRELDDIAQNWGNLASRWTGIAGAAYEPAWAEWHDDAATVTAVLVEHADALVRAVALLFEHENRAAAALAAVFPTGQAPT